ncbi:interferon-inducible GTPase 5-like [Ahaetulla prasina]|uniref:interferon-inducible GTPase 5-like n=1 Tax=Ahaetulla prasina TaxID=499056 RepID=UPI0026498733|nr:interferon-inducible GTPase 5-like [Ahaetulla prasina]XP_058051585.1 interferon-inducible GTPase 5-like [Ahaetulla prasina]XP_058051586.1 interferon-inducible GTPase 5-like [Ahaetulla prasina]
MGNQVPKDFLRMEFEDLKKDLNQGNIHKVAAKYQKQLNEIQKLPLNIAVTGDAGVGKSSFVNAFRGVNDDDDEAAEVGPGKETMELKAYPHPSFPNIKIWDLPGIGTYKVKAAEYLKKVQFESYDVFIMLISDRFTENNAMLAKEIQRMRKKVYYVCSRIDITIDNEKRKRNFNVKDTLASMRKYCERSLKEAAGVSSSVYLISSREVHKYDFPLLQERIAAELPNRKKDILTLSLQIFSEDKLMRKKELMKSYIKKVAWVSCVCGAVPVPGLSMACDVGILIGALRYFCKVFGLDEGSLRFLALQTGKEFEELRSAIKKTPLANAIDAELVFSLLMKSSLWVVMSVVELALDFIPVIGSLFGGASSYVVTYHFLNSFLDDAVEDARNVRAKLLKQ